MKKIIFLLLSFSFLLFSCNSEDSKIDSNFLISSYDNEFHELKLSWQELTQVPNFEKYLTWSYVYDVWSIDLSGNDIINVDWELFKYFPNLKEVNLSYNRIEKIELEHIFIQDLKLHKNMLKEVYLESLSKLNSLNLWYNELLSWKSIKLPNTLKILELQHNKLEDIYWFSKLENLDILKLEFNSLEDIDMVEIKDLKKLKTITVAKNNLSKNLEEKIKEFNDKVN